MSQILAGSFNWRFMLRGLELNAVSLTGYWKGNSVRSSQTTKFCAHFARVVAICLLHK